MPGSPSRVSGRVTAKVEIGGKSYRLTEPQKVGTIGRMEEFILSKRQPPIEFAIDACRMAPASMHTAIWAGAAIAASRIKLASPEEWDTFNGSLWRSAFMFFETLHPRHKKTDVPDVETAFEILTSESVDMAKLIARVRHAAQDDELKNSAGPTATGGSGQIPKTDGPSSPDGPPSTTASPNVTDGPETR